MYLKSPLSIGSIDILEAGVSLHPQGLIIVLFAIRVVFVKEFFLFFLNSMLLEEPVKSVIGFVFGIMMRNHLIIVITSGWI